jgi:hypothetical protein
MDYSESDEIILASLVSMGVVFLWNDRLSSLVLVHQRETGSELPHSLVLYRKRSTVSNLAA